MVRRKKNSNIPWIGSIPESWNLQKSKFLFSQRNEKGNSIELQLLSPTQKYGVIPQTLYEKLSGMKTVKLNDNVDLSPMKTIHKGDFCISLRSFQGGFEYSEFEGVVSPAYQVFYGNEKIFAGYYKFLFKDQSFIEKMNSFTMSLRDGKNIAFSDFANSFLPVPQIEEQKKIAEFLDEKCGAIDFAVENTKASIEEYKKLKRAVITEAVTKGIHGNRLMKDSGNKWIGQIPIDWEIIRLKNVATSFTKGNGITKTDIVENGDVPCVRYGEIYSKYNQAFSECHTRTNLSIISPAKFFSHGDILFACTGEIVKEIGKSIVYLGQDECLAGGDIIVLKHKQNPSFLNYALNCEYAQAQKSYNKTKLKVVHISSTDIGNIVIAIPSLDEQENIADYLDSRCSEIDNIIARKKQYILELEKFKKSLIYEYVTGKKEVPAATQVEEIVDYPYFPAKYNAKSSRFAQAILMSKILDENCDNMGRVKLEKTLYTIENSIGFDFDTEYVRDVAGPFDSSIYDCEGIISRKNKWFVIDETGRGVSYNTTEKKDTYKKYYMKYFSEYDAEIQRIIDLFSNYTTDKAEIIATLFAAWNDAIIDKKAFTDENIVNDILDNWHDKKKRFSKDIWLNALGEMREINLIPKGYGKHTVKKGER